MSAPLKVLVLAGGPDRERPVSLISGASVAAALREAGHHVTERDISPNDLSALDDFRGRGDVVFPVLHGSWGEGGGLQRILDERGVKYVGCRAAAAELCMDKHRTKQVLIEHKLPTPPFEFAGARDTIKIDPPLVLKAPREGSSIDLMICKDASAVQKARADLFQRHERILVEKFVRGKEITVGVLSAPGTPGKSKPDQALPPIHIVPATEYYDYEAKYTRDDTQYLFDIDLPPEVLKEIGRVSLEAYKALGCRHMSRVDLIVDSSGGKPWILEVNTIPGFTSHSLLPKAAAKAGIPMPTLVDRLVRMAGAE